MSSKTPKLQNCKSESNLSSCFTPIEVPVYLSSSTTYEMGYSSHSGGKRGLLEPQYHVGGVEGFGEQGKIKRERKLLEPYL